MSYLQSYLDNISDSKLAVSIRSSAHEFVKNYVDTFSFNEHINGLLLGHVQSGKTGQMFGIVSHVADQKDFKVFVLLTTSQILLQQQTFKRALNALPDFCVCDETDDDKYFENNGKKPVLIVLKKNSRTLKHWVNKLNSTACYGHCPLFILDDEADATSLNTRVNSKSSAKSTINNLLEMMINQAPSSIYVHTTATPQALILQTNISGWKPAFVHVFDPGESYLGGDFFYGETSFCKIETPDNELDTLISGKDIPYGLRRSVLSFLLSSSHVFGKLGDTKSNLLIHPSVRKNEHNVVKQKVEEFLSGIKRDIDNHSIAFIESLKDEWRNLQQTEDKLILFEEALEFIKENLDKVNIKILNSENPIDNGFEQGINIVIGGNSLGRGVTFPQLNTVYYCRSAKIPQADTTWQHARIFGYDRNRHTCRVFSPRILIKLFQDLNDANNALMKVIRKDGIDAVNIMTPEGTNPTRKNVLDKNEIEMTVGGVNYFPLFPLDENTLKLDDLAGLEDKESDITLDEARNILKLIKTEKDDVWNKYAFANVLHALSKIDGVSKYCRLVVRTDRSIGKGTGTLLSPNDRQLGEEINDKVVLTMYKINGEVGKGWDGKPLWIPNVKLPNGICFYKST